MPVPREAADPPTIIAHGRSMRETLATVARVAVTDTTVLLLGESGVGKELLAAAVHQQSSRAQAPFVALNCAALPDTLLESELLTRALIAAALERQRYNVTAAARMLGLSRPVLRYRIKKYGLRRRSRRPPA